MRGNRFLYINSRLQLNKNNADLNALFIKFLP
jgi:hypothetical protein